MDHLALVNRMTGGWGTAGLRLVLAVLGVGWASASKDSGMGGGPGDEGYQSVTSTICMSMGVDPRGDRIDDAGGELGDEPLPLVCAQPPLWLRTLPPRPDGADGFPPG